MSISLKNLYLPGLGVNSFSDIKKKKTTLVFKDEQYLNLNEK